MFQHLFHLLSKPVVFCFVHLINYVFPITVNIFTLFWTMRTSLLAEGVAYGMRIAKKLAPVCP
jgi:hypothetical protein